MTEWETRDLFKKIRNTKGTFHVKIGTVQFGLVSQSCPTLQPHGLQHNRPPCPSPTPGLKLMSIESVMPSNHLILCCPLFLLSIFPSIGVFSNESALRIRWPKYQSFSFNINPTNEHPGLISFRMHWIRSTLIRKPYKSGLSPAGS